MGVRKPAVYEFAWAPTGGQPEWWWRGRRIASVADVLGGLLWVELDEAPDVAAEIDRRHDEAELVESALMAEYEQRLKEWSAKSDGQPPPEPSPEIDTLNDELDELDEGECWKWVFCRDWMTNPSKELASGVARTFGEAQAAAQAWYDDGVRDERITATRPKLVAGEHLYIVKPSMYRWVAA